MVCLHVLLATPHVILRVSERNSVTERGRRSFDQSRFEFHRHNRRTILHTDFPIRKSLDVEGTAKGSAPPADAFRAGDHVRHAKFGEGIVVSCQESSGDLLVTVAFKGNAGLKRLLASFAALERM